MRRVLLVTYPYFPSYHVGVRRVAQLCRHLPANGWEPVVLTKDWDAEVAAEDEFFGRSRSTDVAGEIGYVPRVITGRYARRDNAMLRAHQRLVAEAGRGSTLGRATRAAARKALSVAYPLFGRWPDLFVGWVPGAADAGARAVEELDVAAVVSVLPPQTAHLVGGAIARRTRRPWVPMFDDLFGFYLGPGDFHRTPGRRALARRANRWWLRGASAVTANTAPMLEYLRATYGVDGEVVVPGFAPVPRSDPPRGDAFRIALTGSIYLTEQRPQLFLDALDLLIGRDPSAAGEIEAHFVGTRVESELRAMVAGRACAPVVRITERLPVEESLELQRSSHMLLMLNYCSPQTRLGTMSFPAKTYEYLAARRPILALPGDPGGWGNDLLARTGAGTWADDAPRAAEILASALAQWRGEGRVAFAGRDEEIDRFGAPQQTAVLARLLDRVVERPAARPAAMKAAL